MFNPATVCLGRKAIKTDSRTLRLDKYFTSLLPPPPKKRDWSRGVTSWGMLGNGPDPTNPPYMKDGLGDCTIAGVGHGIQVWSLNVGAEATITTDQAVEYYEKWDGYDPSNPATDQGGICLDVLKAWKAQGFAGHSITAFASVLPANQAHVKQAINLFGGLYTGVSLPITAQGQDVWDVVPNSGSDGVAGSWGGHCVYMVAYHPNGPTCITWGGLQRMTWAFWSTYFDEAYAIISPDFINAAGMSPNGFALAGLELDVTQIN